MDTFEIKAYKKDMERIVRKKDCFKRIKGEIRHLRKELVVLKAERDILKNALNIFLSLYK